MIKKKKGWLSKRITTLKIYVTNNRMSNFIKQKQKLIEVKGKIDEFIIAIGDFNIHLS